MMRATCRFHSKEDELVDPIAIKQPIRRRMPWIIGILVVLLGLVYAGIALFAAERLTHPTNHGLMVDPRDLSEDIRSWSTRTADGLTLRGWYLPTREQRHLIVLVHGMWSSW